MNKKMFITLSTMILKFKTNTSAFHFTTLNCNSNSNTIFFQLKFFWKKNQNYSGNLHTKFYQTTRRMSISILALKFIHFQTGPIFAKILPKNRENSRNLWKLKNIRENLRKIHENLT